MDDRSILGRSAPAFAALLFALATAPLAAQEAEEAPDSALEANQLEAATLEAAEVEAAALEAEESPREAEACLDHPTIRRTRVLNDRNIVFVTRDNTIYNNQLPKECPSLRRGSLVSYPIEQRRLCAGGSFQVLWQTGAGNNYIPAFVCQLGLFVPISESELEDLTAATDESRERRPRRRSRREVVTTEQIELPPAETAPTTGDAPASGSGSGAAGTAAPTSATEAASQ